MQRTYKSKKHAPGGLEPRDVLFSVDDKSSAFDAFFIQNIKQTKQELSCVGSKSQLNAARKIRKRKYVKRIVKEAAPSSHENSSGVSTYLTPDKSIRVNKPQDLFDQLLNSPTTADNAQSVMKSDDLFSKLCENKPKNMYAKRTYCKKIIKKFNCSSDTSSDSDKENISDNTPLQDVTDIRKHELVVEKVKSPKWTDDSIYKIVNNMSLLKQIREKNKRTSDEKIQIFDKNRLTTNLKTPSGSPLCSTPFVAKYRSKSIYNFSPIALNLTDTNKNNDDMDENNDKEAESLVNEVVQVDLPDEVNNHSQIDEVLDHVDADIPLIEDINNVTEIEKAESIISLAKEARATSQKTDSSSANSIQDSTENNPFLGFSNVSHGLANLQNLEKFLRNASKNEVEQSPVLPNPKALKSRISIRKKNFKETSLRNSDNKPDISMKKSARKTKRLTKERDFENSIEMSVQMEPFLGFSEETINQDALNIDRNSIDHTVVETTILEAKTLHSISIESSQEDFNSASDEDIDESNYDTCSSINSGDIIEPRIPIIVMDKMNDSLFYKYYNKANESSNSSINDINSGDEKDDLSGANSEEMNQEYETENLEPADSENDDLLEISSEEMNQECEINALESAENENDDISVVHSDKIISEYETENLESVEIDRSESDSKSAYDTDRTESTGKSSNEDEDIQKHVSFVTTRRRNVADDYILMVLDESRASTSSGDCDQTVISNKIRINLDDISEELVTKEIELDKTTFDDNKTIEEVKERQVNEELFKQTQEIVQDNYIAPIVLQPGKKWERSLSIYRRMTMANETLLEDGEMTKKGRKYRQSVISTMEMQDRGPLHNESVCSRRNTIKKHHRSSIRIVKEPNVSRESLHTTAVYDDLTGFLSEDCDDTLVELSKLSIADEHEITVVGKVDDPPERTALAREYVLRRCNQTEALPFDECYPETLLKNCHKIGEGVYGEVYLYRARDGVRVMKIVPVAGDTIVNGEHQKDFSEVISEIVIAMELSSLRAPIADVERHLDDSAAELDLRAIGNATDVFNEVLAVHCVQGAYPSRLLDLWELYDECKGSENDNPAALPPDQQYIVLELANAGHDLESYQFNSAEQAYALFLQVAYGLAVGEEAFQFEHRDLHWGNVLIAPTEQKHATFILGGRVHRVARRGVAASIIDYSLSRLALPLAAAALYSDLAQDAGLFAAHGDYQFEVYRLMKDKLRNDWKTFEPYTNILWLHYTVDKMITALRYKRTNTKIHKHYIAKLKGIKNRILDYNSSVHFVLNDEF